ncbi:MAG: hypothetical protein OHK0039_07210 [Bacteroidia bacterium]
MKPPAHRHPNTPLTTPIDLIWVEGGTFWMGAEEGDKDARANEKPRHQVSVSGFWLGKYPMTQALWQEVMGSNPSAFPGPDRPVEQVSWDDCQKFLKKTDRDNWPALPPAYRGRMGIRRPRRHPQPGLPLRRQRQAPRDRLVQ